MQYISKEAEFNFVRDILLVSGHKVSDLVIQHIVDGLHVEVKDIEDMLLKNSDFMARLCEQAAKKYLEKNNICTKK